VVGWEEDKTGKYWIIQNSWGGEHPQWKTVGGDELNIWSSDQYGNVRRGNSGLYRYSYGPFLRVARGNDELGLESNPTFLADIRVWLGSGNNAKKVPISRSTWMDEYSQCGNGFDAKRQVCE
jgi:hypothetical protein